MPKSKKRKGARYTGADARKVYGIPDPAQVFWDLGSGKLSGTLAVIAAQHLLDNMSPETLSDPTMMATFGAEWPPRTARNLISIAARAHALSKQEAATDAAEDEVADSA